MGIPRTAKPPPVTWQVWLQPRLWRADGFDRCLDRSRRLIERLAERETTTQSRIESLTAGAKDIEGRIAEREQSVAAGREMLATAERTQDEARDQRTSSQIRRAQAQAQLEVAADRQRHLSEEFASATGRLDSLQLE